MFLAIEADLGQEIVPSRVRALALEFDYIDRS